jgi:hypothetical protein
MAESLLNLGGAVQNMMGVAQLAQMRERTALIQQDRAIDAQRAQEREKVNRINAHLEIAKNPMFEGSPVAIQAMQVVGREYGLHIPDDEAYAGRKALRSFYDTLGDPKASAEDKQKAFFSASVYSPTLLKQGLDSWDKFQTSDDRHRRLMLQLQQDEIKVRGLNAKQQAVELQHGLYATIGGVMSQMMDATKITDAEGKRDLGQTFQKIMLSKDEKERTILRHSVKDLDMKMQERVVNLSNAFEQFYQAKNQELRPLVEAAHQAQAEGREVDDADLGKVKALELLDASKEAVDKWAAQPYDKQAWTRLQNTMRQVQQAAAGSKKELSNLDGVRMGMLENAQRRTNLAEDKEERLALNENAQRYGQQQFLELVAGGMSADKAGVEAGKRTQEMFKILPDSSKFKDPKLSNTLGIREMTPAVQTDIQRGLLATESALNMITNIESVLATSNIGLNAMIKSNVYGFSQQISALAQSAMSDAQAMKAADPKGLKDFTPSKWFDPNIPKVDLLAHSLAMALIKSEQGSRPSDKDFANKVKSLGLQSAMANAPDARVRLKTLREQMEYQRTVYSRLAGKFADRVQGSEGASNAPATAAEYFKRKGIPLPTEEETP